MPRNEHSKPWARVTILLTSLLGLALIARQLTGQFIPDEPKTALIFQNALLLIILGSALLEHQFTKPADSAINGLMGALTLLPVYQLPNPTLWWLIFAYCALVCAIAMICVAVSSGPNISGWHRRIADFTKPPAVIFGSSRILFSIVFLYAVVSFYGVQSYRTATLVLFWGIFVALWPLRIPELLSNLGSGARGPKMIGTVVRTDAPNIVHAIVESNVIWEKGSVKVLQQGDGKQRYVIPLFFQSKEDRILGTCLCMGETKTPTRGLKANCLYEPEHLSKTAEELLGGDKDSRLVGFVDQKSVIAELLFHTWSPMDCKEGMIVWAQVGENRIFYQITNGTTCEETLETDRHGYQIATASQLGILNPNKGFEKFEWLPTMNTPVFALPEGFGKGAMITAPNDFTYGVVPHTGISVTGAFADMMEYHTAILGVTGSGKTELAFDLLRYAISHDTKVICIDLTSRYEGRLADLQPFNLSISGELSDQLGAKLLATETGEYGAPKEKKALSDFAGALRRDIMEHLTQFLVSTDSDKRLGIITLDEISNSKATIFITELYLTCLLHFARDNSGKCPRVLLVVEEAHTVMPEANTMGLGDFDSRGLVGKIAQVALQGRKYGVGLLVIAQRTATVSKTVLTQCNTIVSFSCFDDTSLKFLENCFGPTHTAAIPNLQFLQAVVFGKGVKSQRPIIVQIPFDPNKSEPGALDTQKGFTNHN
jgi:hypothetical protein